MITIDDWNDLEAGEEIVVRNWILQSDRYPFTLDPLRIIGYQESSMMSPNLQDRMQVMRLQLHGLVASSRPGGLCSCKINNGARFNIVPHREPEPFVYNRGLQAVVDLQTGHLHLKRGNLELGTISSEWQYYLQFLFTI